MGLSKLSEKCRICPKVDTCQNKRMEGLAFMDSPCERELATGGIIPRNEADLTGGVAVGHVVAVPADHIEAFRDAVEKAVAIAAQIPQHILCKHYLP